MLSVTTQTSRDIAVALGRAATDVAASVASLQQVMARSALTEIFTARKLMLLDLDKATAARRIVLGQNCLRAQHADAWFPLHDGRLELMARRVEHVLRMLCAWYDSPAMLCADLCAVNDDVSWVWVALMAMLLVSKYPVPAPASSTKPQEAAVRSFQALVDMYWASVATPPPAAATAASLLLPAQYEIVIEWLRQ